MNIFQILNLLLLIFKTRIYSIFELGGIASTSWQETHEPTSCFT
jgi:hypothetical protein